jgi:hypothetical protein
MEPNIRLIHANVKISFHDLRSDARRDYILHGDIHRGVRHANIQDASIRHASIQGANIHDRVHVHVRKYHVQQVENFDLVVSRKKPPFLYIIEDVLLPKSKL